jgi:hypothetical protein
VAATVAAMDEAGVRTGMLCAWWGPRGPLISNDAVATMVSSYPGRFAGVAAVDLTHPVAAVRELRRCVRDLASLRLDEETTEAFLHATAERVFGLAAGAAPASQATTERARA